MSGMTWTLVVVPRRSEPEVRIQREGMPDVPTDGWLVLFDSATLKVYEYPENGKFASVYVHLQIWVKADG